MWKPLEILYIFNQQRGFRCQFVAAGGLVGLAPSIRSNGSFEERPLLPGNVCFMDHLQHDTAWTGHGHDMDMSTCCYVDTLPMRPWHVI